MSCILYYYYKINNSLLYHFNQLDLISNSENLKKSDSNNLDVWLNHINRIKNELEVFYIPYENTYKFLADSLTLNFSQNLDIYKCLEIEYHIVYLEMSLRLLKQKSSESEWLVLSNYTKSNKINYSIFDNSIISFNNNVKYFIFSL